MCIKCDYDFSFLCVYVHNSTKFKKKKPTISFCIFLFVFNYMPSSFSKYTRCMPRYAVIIIITLRPYTHFIQHNPIFFFLCSIKNFLIIISNFSHFWIFPIKRKQFSRGIFFCCCGFCYTILMSHVCSIYQVKRVKNKKNKNERNDFNKINKIPLKQLYCVYRKYKLALRHIHTHTHVSMLIVIYSGI